MEKQKKKKSLQERKTYVGRKYALREKHEWTPGFVAFSQ